MEKICRNCAYYVQISFSSSEYFWGDCRKPVSNPVSNSDKESKSVFKWSDETCAGFKSKQEVIKGGHNLVQEK